ncbi:MAG: V-type ATP synthase subunit D [Bacteroidales bacterium]|nr:V-type ATP synthase subunit D [Bacteroidales bacterium]
MAIKYQFNKTSLNDLQKQLNMRTRALPTIKNKESALRVEVKKARKEAEALQSRLTEQLASYEYMACLWTEFSPDLVTIEDVDLTLTKIAGVRIPTLGDIRYSVRPYSLFTSPAWYADGVQIIQALARTGIEYEVCSERMRILDHARKKTTQKVNLYEKVQIPGYREAILKIKRYLEDEENLSKSSQKIVKKKQEEERA